MLTVPDIPWLWGVCEDWPATRRRVPGSNACKSGPDRLNSFHLSNAILLNNARSCPISGVCRTINITLCPANRTVQSQRIWKALQIHPSCAFNTPWRQIFGRLSNRLRSNMLDKIWTVYTRHYKTRICLCISYHFTLGQGPLHPQPCQLGATWCENVNENGMKGNPWK